MVHKIKLAFDATATPTSLTGAGYYVVEIVKQLDRSDEIDLNILTRKSDSERFSNFAPNSKVTGITPDSTYQRLYFQSFKLAEAISDLNIDLFHGPHYQIPNNLPMPSVVTVHDTTFLTHKHVHKRLKSLYFSKIIPRSISRASSIIAVSNNTKEDIIKILNPKKEIVVAPLGFDTERFNTVQQDDKELLKRRGIEGKFIGYLGLLEPRKRIPDLIKAFSLITNDFPDVRLAIAGEEGWGIDEIRNAIRDSGCATKIILAGRLSDKEVSAFYRQTQCFVYPSIYEGFGMPVLEAFACGAPVITTNSSSLKEVAGNAGILVEPNHPEEIANSLTKILSDGSFRNMAIETSLKRANDFSWENCAEGHIEAYKMALKS